MKEVGFEAGVKERRIEDGQSGDIGCSRSRKRQVRDRDAGMRLTERSRELIPETR